MAEAVSYIGIEPRTIKASNAAAIARGLRVTRDANGECALTGIGTRGDYITLTDIEQNKHGAAVACGGGGKVPVVASEAAVVGDLAYSAANGQVSKTSAGAVLVGRWTLAASGAGVLGEIELFAAA